MPVWPPPPVLPPPPPVLPPPPPVLPPLLPSPPPPPPPQPASVAASADSVSTSNERDVSERQEMLARAIRSSFIVVIVGLFRTRFGAAENSRGLRHTAR